MEQIAVIPNSVIENLLNNQNQILDLLKNQGSENIIDDQMITIKEASNITKLSELKIRQMVDAGTLKSKRYGKAIRIYRNSL